MAGYKNSPTGILDDNRGAVKVSRHWHDLSMTRDTSLPIGKVVPIYNKLFQGNTRLKINTHYALQTNATNSPVFTRLDMVATTVYCPIRLYVPDLYGNNFQEIDSIPDIPLPLFDIFDDGSSDSHRVITIGSLLHRLGYPAIYTDESGHVRPVLKNGATISPLYTADFNEAYLVYNSLSVYAYYDACRYLFADAYDKNIPFEHATVIEDLVMGSDSIITRQYRVLREEYIYDYDVLVSLIYRAKGFASRLDGGNYADVRSWVLTDTVLSGAFGDLPPVSLISSISSGSQSRPTTSWPLDNITTHEGLFPALFKPDLFSAYYDSEETDKLAIMTSGNIQSIRVAQADYNLKASILVRGKQYDKYNEVINGGNVSINDSPVFCGSDYVRIQFQDIVSTAQTENQPLGTPTSRGYGAEFDTPRIDFVTQEPGILLTLCSVVPRVSHNNAVKPEHRYRNFGDIPNRFFDGVGFQDLRAGDMNYTGAPGLDDLSVGSQAYYMEAMVDYDIVDGLLATSGYKSYTLHRQYDLGSDLPESSTLYDEILNDPQILLDLEYGKYMRGSDYEYIFPAYAPLSVEGRAKAQQLDNIFAQIHFDIRAYQPLTNQVITTNSI